MNRTLNTRTLLQEAVFYFKENRLVSKLIALNIFSTIIFFTVENTLFHWWFGMTFDQSIQARKLGLMFNTLVGTSWPMIDDFFRKRFSNHPRKWLRDKWEELALLTVKIIVNGLIYTIVGISSGHFAFDLKLLCKVVVIVLIAYYGADWLKYKMTPWIDSIPRRFVLLVRRIRSEQPTEQIFTVTTDSSTGDHHITSGTQDGETGDLMMAPEVEEEGQVVAQV